MLQIENHKLYFRERAQAKCETWDYFDHIPGGGDKKVCLLWSLSMLLLLVGNVRFGWVILLNSNMFFHYIV